MVFMGILTKALSGNPVSSSAQLIIVDGGGGSKVFRVNTVV